MSRRFIRYYRAKTEPIDFAFEFVDAGSHFDVYCRFHPPLNDRDPDVHKTHLFSDGQLCFVAGKEPPTQQRAEELAALWAEYFLEYRRTGIPQS